jgi:hypothetical protein
MLPPRAGGRRKKRKKKGKDYCAKNIINSSFFELSNSRIKKKAPSVIERAFLIIS